MLRLPKHVQKIKYIFLLFIILLIFSLLSSLYFIISSNGNNLSTPIPTGSKSINKDIVRCTMDVKCCPDGTCVGRVAPSCSFAPCPKDRDTN